MKGRSIRYTAAQLRFIERYRAMNRRGLHAAFVEKFGRCDVTPDHLKSLCTRNGWTTGRTRWSAADDALLRKLYPDTPTADVVRRIGHTVSSTYQRARKLGLCKSDGYLAGPAACRLRRGDNVGAAHRFPKGHLPANKGLRRPGWSAGRMKETQFKKGAIPAKWMPIGSERDVSGYLYTKVSDIRNVPWTKNWKATHIFKWEQLHGPFSIRTHALKSRDGNKKNTDTSNWDLIPRALLPRLNGIYGRGYDRAPAKLKPTILAIAKVEHAAAAAHRRDGEPAWKAWRRRQKERAANG